MLSFHSIILYFFHISLGRENIVETEQVEKRFYLCLLKCLFVYSLLRSVDTESTLQVLKLLWAWSMNIVMLVFNLDFCQDQMMM